MKRLYLILVVAGFAVPYYFLIGFLAANGLNLTLLVGPSFALPLFLYFRETRLNAQ